LPLPRPVFARSVAEGEGCRVEARSAKTDSIESPVRASAGRPIPGKRSGCPTVNRVSEVTNWSVTSASHHFGLVAQLVERPVVCGRVEGATPFGSAIFAGITLSKVHRFHLHRNKT